MRFVGHLDILRFFQKAIARSGIVPIYTQGYNPHMILSFAAPLGVGDSSLGEYFDLECAYRDPFATEKEDAYLKDLGLDPTAFAEAPTSEEIVQKMNLVMADGVKILSARRIGEGRTGNAMASVAMADYIISFRDGFLSDVSLPEMWPKFLESENIFVEKEGKSGKHTVDVRPMILESSLNPLLGGIYLRCLTGSAANLKPELLISAFCSFLQKPYDELAVQVCRLDLFDDHGVSLGEAGQILERG